MEVVTNFFCILLCDLWPLLSVLYHGGHVAIITFILQGYLVCLRLSHLEGKKQLSFQQQDIRFFHHLGQSKVGYFFVVKGTFAIFRFCLVATPRLMYGCCCLTFSSFLLPYWWCLSVRHRWLCNCFVVFLSLHALCVVIHFWIKNIFHFILLKKYKTYSYSKNYNKIII